MEAVDKRFGALILKHLEPHLDLPSSMFERAFKDLLSHDYTATSTKQDLMIVHGTVLSGHPMFTTLFNTIRSILY